MPGVARFLRLTLVVGALAAVACNSKGSLQGTGGAGGSGGAGGASCPAERPSIGAECVGSGQCDYEDLCRCGACCFTTYRCTDGSIAYAGSSDACYNATCDAGPPPDGPPGSGTAGTGGSGGGGAGGDGGGSAGGSGGSGGAGGTPLSSCPASIPNPGTACAGSFMCKYDTACRCGICCYRSYSCTNGSIVSTGATDSCYMVTCDAGSSGSAVCTFGADQTCNDNPIVSSIRGHCTDAGVCACNGDAGTNPDSGRCL